MVVDVSIMDIYVSSKNVDGYFHCIIVGLGLSPVYQWISFSKQLRTLDTCPELRDQAMEVLCALATQLGRSYECFIPIVYRITTKHKIHHPRYDILVAKVVRVSPPKKLSCYLVWKFWVIWCIIWNIFVSLGNFILFCWNRDRIVMIERKTLSKQENCSLQGLTVSDDEMTIITAHQRARRPRSRDHQLEADSTTIKKVRN